MIEPLNVPFFLEFTEGADVLGVGVVVTPLRGGEFFELGLIRYGR